MQAGHSWSTYHIKTNGLRRKILKKVYTFIFNFTSLLTTTLYASLKITLLLRQPAESFFFYSRQIQIIILINIVLLRLLLLICWTCLDWNIQAWKIEFKLILLYFSNMNHSLRIESFIHYHHPNFVYNFKFFLRVTYPPSNGRSRSFII